MYLEPMHGKGSTRKDFQHWTCSSTSNNLHSNRCQHLEEGGVVFHFIFDNISTDINKVPESGRGTKTYL